MLQKSDSATASSASGDLLRCTPQLLTRAAEARGIPWVYHEDLKLLQLGYGRNRRLIRGMTTDRESDVAIDLAQDKEITKKLLSRHGIPVPQGMRARSEAEAIAAFFALGEPMVVKPVDGHMGNGVSLGLKSADQVGQAYRIAARFCPQVLPHVLVEKQITGRDFRVLVIGHRVFAAAEREPAHVVGDGAHTIAELIELENLNPLRGQGHGKPMTRIRMDQIAEAYLARAGIQLGMIPKAGERVNLREAANFSQGGSARDVTDELHAEVRALCERIAEIIGLPLCGIDLVLEDISKPPWAQSCAVIEVNAGPGIRMHHFPSSGEPRDAAGAIVDYLFQERAIRKVPVIFGGSAAAVLRQLLIQAQVRTGEVTDPALDAIVFDGGFSGEMRGRHLYDFAVLMREEDAPLLADSLHPGSTLIVDEDQPKLVELARKLAPAEARPVFFSADGSANGVSRELLAAAAVCESLGSLESFGGLPTQGAAHLAQQEVVKAGPSGSM